MRRIQGHCPGHVCTIAPRLSVRPIEYASPQHFTTTTCHRTRPANSFQAVKHHLTIPSSTPEEAHTMSSPLAAFLNELSLPKETVLVVDKACANQAKATRVQSVVRSRSQNSATRSSRWGDSTDDTHSIFPSIIVCQVPPKMPYRPNDCPVRKCVSPRHLPALCQTSVR